MLKKSRNYVAMLLALLMCVLSVSPALAANDGFYTTTPDTPMVVVITKNLRLPVGTETPEAKFVFDAQPVSKDGLIDEETLKDMPELNHLEVNYTAANKGENETDSEDVMTIVRESGNILAGVDFNDLGAGIYVYEITESEESEVSSVDANNHQLILSKAKYTLTIYVENLPAPAVGTYVFGVMAKVEETDTEGGANAEEKVDMRPDGHGLIFTNTYVKQNNPDNPDPLGDDATLSVTNTVTGPMAAVTHPFEYAITMISTTIHPEVELPEYYRAYIVEGDKVLNPSNNATSSLIGTPGEGHPYIKVDPNGVTNFTLTNGQKLVFVDTPVGTRYDITQQGLDYHEPSYAITTNSIVGATGKEDAGDAITTGSQRIEEPVNIAAFLNTRIFEAPMGLTLANLPFVMMIALGLGCLVAYIVVGTRRRREY